MKLSRNRSHIQHGISQERPADGSFKSSSGLFRVILHSFLCIAALVVGFRLSVETRLVVVSMKQVDYGVFTNGIFKSNRSHSVVNDRKDFSSTILSEPPPSGNLKSSRVHVGRHEILIRSWPHPDPVQSVVAHQLIKRVQQEQEQRYGIQERKLVVVVTPTYVRALQTVYLACLTHTLRIAPGPLVWVVVEAGGHSNETAELLSQSKLSYYHLAIQEPMPTVSKDRKQLEIQLRLKGLRFIRDHRLDGIVVFVDDSNTLDLELFDIAQKTDWFGTFSVGLLFHSEVATFSEAGDLHSGRPSMIATDAKPDSGTGSFRAMNMSTLYAKSGNSPSDKEDLPSRFSLLLKGPVCDPEGHMVGWCVPFDAAHKQFRRPSRKHEWAGFALNSRIFWDDDSKPPWIKSWNDFLVKNSSLPESPLAFVWNNSYIEPLGDCGRNIMVWQMGIETDSDCKFPSRWIISPPLEVVVPSRQTSWSTKYLGDSNAFGSSSSRPPPPPQAAHLLNKFITQHGKGRIKKAKPRKEKHRSHNTKDGQVKWHAKNDLDDVTGLNAISP